MQHSENSPFQLTTELTPAGDQPEAIRQLVEGLRRGDRYQTLLGVTGSGKTFTISNVLQQYGKPVLVMSPLQDSAERVAALLERTQTRIVFAESCSALPST